MNVLFITQSNINSINDRGIYADLLRKFRKEGHYVFIVSPSERRLGQQTHLIDMDGVKILKVKTLNVQKTNVIEKGFSILIIERLYKRALIKYFGHLSFDLILYSTPPITFVNVVKYMKKKNPQAISYLLLKDIFPQNAVDVGMFSKKSILYWLFRRKEMALYNISDFIGCMSPANVDFLKDHNPNIPKDKMEVAPNSIELTLESMDPLSEEKNRELIRRKFDLPTDKPIFIYGGNLGIPQGIDYIIKCLDAIRHRTDCFFVIVGNGTEYCKIDAWINKHTKETSNLPIKLMKRLSKEDYDLLLRSCDVGLIFLDHRFTIPNFPSRLLPYLENKIPVLCATDPNTDIGKIADQNGFGFWCVSINPKEFVALVDKVLISDRIKMGLKGYEFLKNNFQVDNTYNIIMKHI